MRVFRLTNLAAALILCSTATVMAQQPPYLAGLQIAPSPSAAPAPNERELFFSPDAKKSLPRLGDRFTVKGPASKTYNAWSYIMGVTDRWLSPEAGTADNPFAGVDGFLAQAGYRRLPTMDVAVRPGTQKVVVYGTLKSDGDIDQNTNAVLQDADGKWSCKPGSLPLIGFDDLLQLRGPAYGLPVAVYERSTTAARTTMTTPYPITPVRY